MCCCTVLNPLKNPLLFRAPEGVSLNVSLSENLIRIIRITRTKRIIGIIVTVGTTTIIRRDSYN